MHPVSESDHGSLYQGCADPSGGSRIFDVDFRNFCSYGWSNPSFHIVPLFGKAPASPICQHSVSVVEYQLELHYDFRQAGDLTHGCAWCGICYSNFPMCQFSADAPNAFQKRFPFEIQRKRTHCNTPNELGAVLVYAAAFAGMRGGVESGGKCLCHHLRAHEYRCQCCYDFDQSHPGIGDRCVVRIVSSGKCDHRKTPGQW